MSKVATIENAAMERQEWQDTKPQDWYTGRLKFTCCHRCGSEDGMQAVHRDTLAEAIPALSWYKEPGNAEYLFYPCPRCNHWRIIPDGYAHVSLDDIQAWLDRDPMQPNYAALAAEGPVLASQDSRKGAGLEE